MSWAASLCDLYDAHAARAGQPEYWTRGGKTYSLLLLPVGHSTALAQIEVTIDGHGDFVSARTLDKSEGQTMIPITEASAARTSTPVAMPLFDKLAYVAGDYNDHTESKKAKKKEAEKTPNQLYLEGLKAWCDSDFSHPKVRAIYAYASKGTLVRDLLQCGALQADKNGMLAEDVKIGTIAQNDAFVRFRVFSEGEDAIWLDKTVQKSFTDYVRSSETEQGLCYLTGKRMVTAALHPKKIRNEGDMAKLISANDSCNFTYRGRFLTKENTANGNEALSIGYETSQKMHAALKWIIRRQGYTRDGVCMVAWESALRELPDFYLSAAEMLRPPAGVQADTDLAALLHPKQKDLPPETNYTAAQEFNAAIDGYRSKLADPAGQGEPSGNDSISKMRVLALDSATPGRLALTYYKELSTSRYLENIKTWHESCRWRHACFLDGKYHVYEGMASIPDIAKAVYGTEQGGFLALGKNRDKSPLLAATFERLRPCILDGAAVPRDMVRAAVLKASNPLAYEKRMNYEAVLSIACSLVKRVEWEKTRRNQAEGVVLDMELDLNNTNRSYLYGRALAVAEWAERSTYERDDARTTNAERYMQTFSVQPFRTLAILRRNLVPYLNSMPVGRRKFYQNLFEEITSKFVGDDYTGNRPLDGLYLAGYDCQRTALKNYKENGRTDAEQGGK